MLRAEPTQPPTVPRSPDPAALRAAFRELHGPRLHGFALLLTLGDRPRAAALTERALVAGEARAPALRHPERAAAWLRARVVSGAGRPDARLDAAQRRTALSSLGVDGPVLAGLAGLGRLERAALVAAWSERLDRRDVGAIVGRDGRRLDALVRRAGRRFLDGYASAGRVSADAIPATPDGPIMARVRAAASRAMP